METFLRPAAGWQPATWASEKSVITAIETGFYTPRNPAKKGREAAHQAAVTSVPSGM
jgi:hypothetical protein